MSVWQQQSKHVGAVYVCHSSCGGWGDRAKALLTVAGLSLLAGRSVGVEWASPGHLSDLLEGSEVVKWVAISNAKPAVDLMDLPLHFGKCAPAVRATLLNWLTSDTLVELTQLHILFMRAARWDTKSVKRSAGDSSFWYGVRTVVQHEHAKESATLSLREAVARRAACLPIHRR